MNIEQGTGNRVSVFKLQIKLQDSDILYLYTLWSYIGWLSKSKAPFYTVVAELQKGV